LKSIGTGTGQHLVDADDVVRVDTDSHVEAFLSSDLDEVLVGANASGFERLGAELFVLVGDEVNAGGEVIDTGLLPAQVEDSYLSIGHTTVEARLGVRLVLAVTVASGWAACHCSGVLEVGGWWWVVEVES
jgi:hypothetical protein